MNQIFSTVNVRYCTTGNLSYKVRYVTDASEAKAYVDQSLTGTVGSNKNFKGAIRASGVSEDAMQEDHGYEWDNPIQDPTTFSYYNSLMESYNLIPISTPANQ